MAEAGIQDILHHGAQSGNLSLPDKVADADPALRAVAGTAICRMEFTDVEREDFRNLLQEIAETNMPFGKFGRQEVPPHGVPLMDLPPEYLAWFAGRGFPKGRLGELMAEVWNIKATGMDEVFEPFRRARGGRTSLRPPRQKVLPIRQAGGREGESLT